MVHGNYQRTEEHRLKQSETMKRLLAEGMVHGMKGKHHSEITKQKQSDSHKGYIPSEETKQKLRIINSGENNPMFGVHKFGKDAPNHGKTKSEEARRKISEGHKGHITSEETKKKISNSMTGRKFSEEHIQNLSKSHKGKTTWNKDLTSSKDSRVLAGDKNPNWQGGLSFGPYTKEFNLRFKKAIKERDCYCMLCKVNFEDLKLLKRQIDVHHIDYSKENSIKENCCVLCRPCHMRTNFDRPIWTKHFQSLLSEKYNYQYDDNQNIIINLEALT